MNSLRIEIQDNRTVYQPGDIVMGRVGWELDERPKAVEVRLFWYTRGKGSSDVEIVDRARFEHPAKMELQQFRLKLPEAPYSCSGKLISILWAVEAVVEPSDLTQRVDLVMSPTGKEIVFNPSPYTPTKK